jgi:glutamyl-tRNA synthetase
VNKAPAVFSYEKLDHFNGVYIRGTSPEQLLDLLLPFIVKSGLLQPSEIDTNREYLLSIVPLIQERITLLGEIGDHIWFFFDHSFKVKEPQSLIPRKAGPEDAHRILAGAKDALSGLDPFTDEQIEQALRGLVNELSLKVGQVFMTLRVAVTGSKVSPGLFETIRVLGRERTLKRLEAAGDLVP